MRRIIAAVFCGLVLCISVTAKVNLTFILKRDGTTVTPKCLAEELERYAAVAWIYPIPTTQDELPQERSTMVPFIQHDFNCKFSSNDPCNVKWTLKDWHIDDNSSKTREYIDDNRWEDLPTILIGNNTKDFEKRYHIEAAQNNGFSLRAAGPVEMFLCLGWNPKNYPCYYLSIAKKEIFLSKFAMWNKDVETPKLATYTAASNIITDDEWRSFEVSVDANGKVLLTDKNLQRTVIEYNDKEPLKPMYLFLRSAESSLWKISENQFMFTKKAHTSRMGPKITQIYLNLCISLLVATCSNCEMSFFYMNGTHRIILKHVGPTNDKWIEIKLKQENIGISNTNIFVETKFVNDDHGQREGWWAYDDVRICTENEAKVTSLNLSKSFEKDDSTVDLFTCQLVKKPSFRPAKLEYDSEEVDPIRIVGSTNETSIKVTLYNTDPDNFMTYFIGSQGTDDCENDKPYEVTSQRVRSTYFTTTKHNEFTFTNLIPYTNYVVKVTSVLEEPKWDYLNIRTLETEEPVLEELPIKMHIQPTDTTVNITWDKPKCDTSKGRLIYTVNVFSDQYKYNQIMDYRLGNSFKFEDLRPFTTHTVKVWTARNARMLTEHPGKNVIQYNFTTLSGVAPAVENLEVYAIGSTSAHLRFDLPSNNTGVPSDVQLITCNKLSYAKCRPMVSKLEKCPLWSEKYCVDANNLLTKQAYVFKVSLKNQFTENFGVISQVTDYSVEKVPSPPTNITYRVVDCDKDIDYCHLNITWRHPYFPNGTINSFHVILNNTKVDVSVQEPLIQEVHKITNNRYHSRYIHQVKYIPYGQTYNISIQSANTKYKSAFATSQVTTPDISQYIDQKPRFLAAGQESVVFKLQPIDRRLQSYNITVVVQDFNKSVPVNLDNVKDQKLYRNLCHPYGVTWISQVVEVKSNKTKNITISNVNDEHSLKPNTSYCITFWITNKYHGTEHQVVHSQVVRLPESPAPPLDVTPSSAYNHLYLLLLLLLLVPIGFIVYRCIRKRSLLPSKKLHVNKSNENVYETVPFDEDRNAVTNHNYDRLNFK